MKQLSPQQIEQFRRDGFLVAPGFYDKTRIARIIDWVDEMQQWPDAPGRYWRYYEGDKKNQGRKLLNRMEHFSKHHQGFRALLVGSEMEAAVSDLLGEPAVLLKEKINFKLPGGGGFEPHQDQQAGWWKYADFFISALVCIDEATEENGCLQVVAGRHKEGIFREWEPLTPEDMTGMEFVFCPTKPGDVIFFDSYAPHRSEPNRSSQQRRLLFATYNRLSDGNHEERYHRDKQRAFPQDCEREEEKAYTYRV
ncbi:MAG: Phytanoyl-CoA dioxygenase (PhyH) [Candidatus Kentron sp. G]|nr:MAG: Phytanoyl-CoA dioxygenase (PhyH) [Candidatus Kentron sp. G]VFN00672.1 MAG: Phytanoyl-CoA dioxygenase (PhyH) [Candidatus Kentron sp. G]VFN02055.1 MAG: Phytanoyl-CoA dioxygenase (PhyH) [Candidatus Kentron sp. G]